MKATRWFDNGNPTTLRILAFALLVAGVATCFFVSPTGKHGDDFAALYTMGSGILTGRNVYDLRNFPADFPDMLYPPASGFPFALFAMLPYALAKPAFLWVMVSTLVVGLRALIKLAAPDKGPHVWMGLAGIVLMSSAIRWGVMLLQMAPLLLGLLCLFIVALHTGRSRWAVALATLATAMKVTLALPFLGLLVLHRRFTAIVIAGGTWAVLCGLGFMRLGPDSLATYRLNVAGLQALNNPENINMPDPWQAISLPRLDWTYLFYGLTGNLPVSQILTYLACGVVGLILLREIVLAANARSLASTTSFLTPMICLGCLAVYHHHYDLCLFFAPALLLFFDKSLQHPAWAVALTLPLLLMILVLPIGGAQHLSVLLGVPAGPALVKLSFVVALTLALFGSLAMLRARRLQLTAEQAIPTSQ